MPETSVICIAKNANEVKSLKAALKKQTYRNFEFVFSDKKGIPQAWNDAISRANGKIMIITESDAMPLDKKWLELMVKAVKKHGRKAIIRGIEVSPMPWCFCNLGCYSEVLKKYRLDERFSIAEDTDLFSRLRKDGYRGLELPIAPVFHKRKNRGFIGSIKQHYTYGKLLVMINQKYGFIDFSKNDSESSFLKRELTVIFSRMFYIIGAIVGFLMSKAGRMR
jgi:glycosyltransferase involved in cell wall biosynthesis